jgi:two-component system nitrogen regulation response regulator GlnG
MSLLGNIWIVDDDRSIRWVLEKALSAEGLDTESFESADMMLSSLERGVPDAIISDIRMPGTDGLQLLKHIQDSHPEVPIIIMTAHSDLDSAVASYKGGAFEYLPKPFDVDEAVALVKRALAHAMEQREQVVEQVMEDSTEIIGEAPAMQEVFRAIGRLSQSNITVLINGESGTGKELVAHALHKHSPRKEKPFIPLNMAAIPHDLIESELFGHEKGAFTGAAAARRGRFEQADGGTLFLDEIGDMPADTQTRLLRVLADGEFYRVGGHTPVQVDVRIIAATHQDLENLVQEGRFREDLFHRLNVIRVHLPKLSERREDIPRLADFFLGKAAKELDVEPKILLQQTVDYMQDLSWPGNVRQLENTCRWITVMASGREVHLDDLPPELMEQKQSEQTGNSRWQSALNNWADQALSQGQKKYSRHCGT